MSAGAQRAAEPSGTTEKVPAWVYRLDVEPPARHDGWRRAIRILHIRRRTEARRRRSG